MNKEQIIDETYENYQNYPLATIHDHRINLLYQNRGKGWCMLNGRSMTSPHPTRHLTKEEFINKCKTDTEFSEMWGLKIEERELSFKERRDLSYEYAIKNNAIPLCIDAYGEKGIPKYMETINNTGWNIPTKLITITYSNEKIESYE